MKFDVVIGNPPYQAPTKNKGAGHTLWDKFVTKSFEITKEEGFISLIHPVGWRRITGKFTNLGQTMMSKNIKYLEIHDIKDGQKVFGVCTRYDWYILQNKNYEGKTIVKDEDGNVSTINLTNIRGIPNGQFKNIYNLMATNPNNRINVLHSESAYEPRKAWMSKEKDETHKYPCIYSLPLKGMQFRWSNTKDNGHFGIPKLIWSNGACPQIIIDETGEYGLTQWAFAIVDDVKNLHKIKKAMESDEFVALCKYMRFTLDKYDAKFIASLRKDFWKKFI